MTLTEIYHKGSEILGASKGLEFNLWGVETEFVLRHNREVFDRYVFRQKAIDVEEATTTIRLLDVKLEVPLIMSSITAPIPVIQKDGLMKVARALKSTGSMMSLGSPMPPNLKELVEVGVPIIQTFKPIADRAKLMEMVLTAGQAGVTWLGIEVDAGMGTKIRDRIMVKDCAPVSVEELKEIKQRISCPFILKGILSGWDAEKALEAEADVIVVSNHGAHSLDYLPHPLEMMDEIVSVIGHKIPIIVDGGFRRGSDVLKGLASGAQAIGLGRPILYGLAADGENGVRDVITGIADELRRIMTMTGVKTPLHADKSTLIKI